jgi:hypothetical protein
MLLKELLTEDGSMWLHCDTRRGHYLKCMIDEVLGADHFVNQIVTTVAVKVTDMLGEEVLKLLAFSMGYNEM